MSNKDLTLAVILSAKDGMSKQAEAAFKKMNKIALDASTGMIKSNSKVMASQQRMYQDRERLGIRSEQRIQRELKVTESAYQRLMRSGNLSMREQTRATEAMRSKVQQLNTEMGKLSKMQRAMNGGKLFASAAAGLAVGGMVVKPAVEKAMSYDLRLANMANTAYAGQNIGVRKSGMRYLNKAVTDASRFGIGSDVRGQAAETLDALIASGTVSTNDAATMLPTLMKASTGSNSSAVDLANIGIRGMQTFKIKPSDMPKMIDMATSAGQSGGFELKDMAKWLPQQMAAAAQSGMGGTAGFAKLVSLNQASAITAGTKDEAGNNLVNLLAKINSSDTAQDAKKLGVNLPKYLAQQRSKGVDSVDAFVGLADQQVGKSKAWQQLQKKLASSKNDSDKRDTLESMGNIVQGSTVGKLIQDRQALMALVGIMNNRKYVSDINNKALKANGLSDDNYSLISDTASFKTGQLGNEKDIAQQNAMDSLTPSIGKLADVVVTAAKEHSSLATATVAATTAIAALGATALAASGVGLLSGGKGGTAKKVASSIGSRFSMGGFGSMLLGALPLGAMAYATDMAGDTSKDKSRSSSLLGMTGKLNNFFGYDPDQAQREWRAKKDQELGILHIKIDSEGRATSTMTSVNKGLKVNMSNGPTMVNN